KPTRRWMGCGVVPGRAGQVRLAGRPLGGAGSDLRREFGIVPQEVAIYDELTARENLQFFGELYGLGGATLRQRVDEVLEAVGLTAQAGQRVRTFSGGMRRRLNLGAGLVHRPRLLLLDGPTGGVDPPSRNHLLEEIPRPNPARRAR